jgi:hypothetical protein
MLCAASKITPQTKWGFVSQSQSQSTDGRCVSGMFEVCINENRKTYMYAEVLYY